MNINFRYLLFGYDVYYPTGGFNDFIFEFSTFDEFKGKLENMKNYDRIYFEYFEILDLLKLENFRILYLKDKDVNIKSKLKRAVRGYFAYDKSR